MFRGGAGYQLVLSCVMRTRFPTIRHRAFLVQAFYLPASPAPPPALLALIIIIIIIIIPVSTAIIIINIPAVIGHSPSHSPNTWLSHVHHHLYSPFVCGFLI